MKRLIEVSKRTLGFRSTSLQGTEELVGHLQNLLSDRGMEVKVQQVVHSIEGVSKRQFNVIGVIGDPLVDSRIRQGLLLISHLDTPEPGQLAHWSRLSGDPFTAMLDEDYLYGLGAADGKLDFLCKVFAASKFREKKLKMPIYVVGTCGEKIGMLGTQYLLDSMALNPQYVVAGIPSELRLIQASKSLLRLRLEIGFQTIQRDARGFSRRVSLRAFGRTSHSAYPEVGRDALEQLLEFLDTTVETGFDVQVGEVDGGSYCQQVPDAAKAELYLTTHQFEDYKRFFREQIRADGQEGWFELDLGGIGDRGISFLPQGVYDCLKEVLGLIRRESKLMSETKDDLFSTSNATVRLAQVRTQKDALALDVEYRMLPGQEPKEVEDRLRGSLAKLAEDFPGLNLVVNRLLYHPALVSDAGGELAKHFAEALKEKELDPAPETISLSSEAGLFAQAGYESVAFGPGSPVENLHCPNEKVEIDQLLKAASVYESLIQKVCL
jgi:acetylornithine deacetylase/succinyl-diaminopimelate desuccinylase-like protein